MKRQRLSLERHKEIGKYLYRLQDEIGSLLSEISRAEGVSAMPTRNIEKVYSLLIKLRSGMENVMFRDYPKEGDIRIYYPGDSIDETNLTTFETFIQTLDFGGESE